MYGDFCCGEHRFANLLVAVLYMHTGYGIAYIRTVLRTYLRYYVRAYSLTCTLTGIACPPQKSSPNSPPQGMLRWPNFRAENVAPLVLTLFKSSAETLRHACRWHGGTKQTQWFVYLKTQTWIQQLEIHIKLIPKLITDTSFNLFIHIRCVDLHGGGGTANKVCLGTCWYVNTRICIISVHTHACFMYICPPSPMLAPLRWPRPPRGMHI